MTEYSPKKNVASILDSQRKEGEARDLLKDLQKLISLKRERKIRWVWELIQNAVDCFDGKKVNVLFTLTNDKVIIEHDGEPFQIENLIALVRKTSTKSVEGLEGKKGKFGTGFITTHVLNLKVTVSGIFRNEDGYRPFSLIIDRSSDSLPVLMDSLDDSFRLIDGINEQPPVGNTGNIKTGFEYELEDHKFLIAKDGLVELKRDLPYTLLINGELLHSVSIIDEVNNMVSFSLDEPVPLFPQIGFSKIIGADSNQQISHGLMFSENEFITIAFPAIKKDTGYFLTKIEEQARVFRNFPLIGTERSHFPCLLHSDFFQPTEPRDGIRTLKDVENKPDKHADENRRILKLYVELFKSTFTELHKNGIQNLHLLAESGLPDDPQNYMARDWFELKIQKPIRDFLIEYKLVNTVSGDSIKIGDAKFIKTYDIEYEEDLYSIISELFSSKCPNKETYKDWKNIVEQDEESWPKDIYIDIENVLREIHSTISIDKLKLFDIDSVKWLNNLIAYIQKTGKIDLTEQYRIYLSQSNLFKLRFELKLDPGFSDHLKNISKSIFRNLFDELISNEIINQDGIQDFDTTDFFNSLNKFIGNLEILKSTEDQTKAIFGLGSMFRNSVARKRNEWFEITSSLLPALSSKQIFTDELNDFEFDSVDKWTLKYVCTIIQKAANFNYFCQTYFENNIKLAYEWLNRFIGFICSSEDSRDVAFKYSIILTQDGAFKKYDSDLYRESNPEDFEVLFKDMVKDYTGKKDPRQYLIDLNITNDYLPAKNADYLTEQIDKLFGEVNIESAVEEGGKLNSLFHKLNDWYTKEEGKESYKPQSFFPIFKSKRPDLSVRAYGKEMSKIMAEKGLEEIKALTKLKLKASELILLERASELAGGTQILLDKAQEIFDEAERIRWRKLVGTAAETAFKDLMGDVETRFEIDNPDIGKDFTIISKETGKEFYVEVKSTVIGEEQVKMSSLQGQTAYDEKHRYALCVITRPGGTIIEKDYFLQNVKFVLNIGDLIGDKLMTILNDLKNITEHEQGDVKVAMDNKTYSIYIKKKIWETGIGFNEFTDYLKDYLQNK